MRLCPPRQPRPGSPSSGHKDGCVIALSAGGVPCTSRHLFSRAAGQERQIDMKDYSLDDGVAGVIALDAGIDPHLAADAGSDAQDVLSYVRDAARTKSQNAKDKYLRKAQTHLKDVCSRQHPELVQAIQTRILALQGRGGDTELAHLTPGEVIIPLPLQTPEVMAALSQAAEKAGLDLGRMTVGDSGNSVNPETGVAEFFHNSVSQSDANDVDEIVVVGRRPGGGVTSIPVNYYTQFPDLPSSDGPVYASIPDFNYNPYGEDAVEELPKDGDSQPSHFDDDQIPKRSPGESREDYINRLNEFLRNQGLPEIDPTFDLRTVPEDPGPMPMPTPIVPRINPFDR